MSIPCLNKVIIIIIIKCCRNQVSVSGFKRSFEDGEAGEGGREKNFANVVP
jgi:hypothetical protein